jgi:MFS superfamily sulfate permease-like transporter
VGIAYAVASGVPGIYGLYATIVPLLAYALFGPSRILVLGPDSPLAAMMAVVSGIVCIVTGLARLGFVTELLSKPIRYGYMNGIALTVLISQLLTQPSTKAVSHTARSWTNCLAGRPINPCFLAPGFDWPLPGRC